MHALPPSPPAPTIMKASRPSSEVSAPTYTPYRSTHAAMNPTDGGPNALGLQPSQGDEQKKGKYDHLKRTVRLPLLPPPRHQRICIESESKNGHPYLWSTFHKLRLPFVPVPSFRTS
jgi:hypothetical protein